MTTTKRKRAKVVREVCPRDTHDRTCYVHGRCNHPDALKANAAYTRELNARRNGRKIASSVPAERARVYLWRGQWRVVYGEAVEVFPTRQRALNRAHRVAGVVVEDADPMTANTRS